MKDVLPELRGPVGDEHRMRRAGHRVLVDADRRGEEARDEVEALILGPAGDDDAAGRERTQRGEIRPDRPDRLLVGRLEDDVLGAHADVNGLDPQGPDDGVGPVRRVAAAAAGPGNRAR
ncbi:MAG: hypothetical protein MZV64_63085 [Ignavibacteriales bacterium]|nr:hypothetical protein [Ignavibacteriales bacterium]